MHQHRWQSIEVPVTALVLDPNNVRLDVKEQSQAAIIQDLFLNEDAFRLVESFITVGYFNNDLPVVVEDSTGYVVLEGNRRVAALKFMLAPHLVPRYEKKLHHLLQNSPATDIETIEVKLAPSRDEALPLLGTLHTTQSRKPWSRLRQAYYYYAQVESGSRNPSQLALAYPQVDIPRFIAMWEMHQLAKKAPMRDQAHAAAIARRDFPITTFERIYTSKHFQNHYAITITKDGTVETRATLESLGTALVPLLEQLAMKKVDSRTLNKDSAIAELIATLPKPETMPQSPPAPITKLLPHEEPTRPTTSSKQTTAVVPNTLRCALSAPGVKRRLQELQQLPYRKYPITSADAIRSLLECALKAFCLEHNIQPKRVQGQVHLRTTLIAVKNHLETQQRRKDLVTVLNKLISDSSTYSITDQLNAANHNQHTIYGPAEIKQLWDTIEPIVRFALDPKYD